MRVQGLKEKSLVNERMEKVDALKPIAEEVGASLAQLALAWCAANPHVSTVIMGATKEHQVTSPPLLRHQLLLATYTFFFLKSTCSQQPSRQYCYHEGHQGTPGTPTISSCMTSPANGFMFATVLCCQYALYHKHMLSRPCRTCFASALVYIGMVNSS